METLKTILKTILAIWAALVITGGLIALEESRNQPQTDGFEYSLEAFNKNCVEEAAKNASIAVATNYCTCVYNDAKTSFGKDFSKEVLKAGEQGLTPEWNTIVNRCIVKET